MSDVAIVTDRTEPKTCLYSIKPRRPQSDETELNWHGFVFDELTNRKQECI